MTSSRSSSAWRTSRRTVTSVRARSSSIRTVTTTMPLALVSILWARTMMRRRRTWFPTVRGRISSSCFLRVRRRVVRPVHRSLLALRDSPRRRMVLQSSTTRKVCRLLRRVWILSRLRSSSKVRSPCFCHHFALRLNTSGKPAFSVARTSRSRLTSKRRMLPTCSVSTRRTSRVPRTRSRMLRTLPSFLPTAWALSATSRWARSSWRLRWAFRCRPSPSCNTSSSRARRRALRLARPVRRVLRAKSSRALSFRIWWQSGSRNRARVLLRRIPSTRSRMFRSSLRMLRRSVRHLHNSSCTIFRNTTVSARWAGMSGRALRRARRRLRASCLLLVVPCSSSPRLICLCRRALRLVYPDNGRFRSKWVFPTLAVLRIRMRSSTSFSSTRVSSSPFVARLALSRARSRNSRSFRRLLPRWRRMVVLPVWSVRASLTSCPTSLAKRAKSRAPSLRSFRLPSPRLPRWVRRVVRLRRVFPLSVSVVVLPSRSAWCKINLQMSIELKLLFLAVLHFIQFWIQKLFKYLLDSLIEDLPK